MLKLALFNVKNIVRSKPFKYLIIAGFLFSLMLLIAGQSRSFALETYVIYFGRFLYNVILYASLSVMRNDIIADTIKTLFTGIFSRTKIMMSKLLSLIILGIIFSLIIELDGLLLSILDWRKIGVIEFLKLPHFKIILTYVVITFSVGAFMILINSIFFNRGKNILSTILFLSVINFNNSYIVTLAYNNIEFAEKISFYAKTPLYIWTDLLLKLNLEILDINEVLMAIAYGLIFSACSILILNKREIK